MDSPTSPTTCAQDHKHIRRLSVDNPLYNEPRSPVVIQEAEIPDASEIATQRQSTENFAVDSTCADAELTPGSPAMPTAADLDAGWASLPRSIFRQVAMLLAWHEVRVIRRVCSAWRVAHGTAVAGLTPTNLQANVVGGLFPSLVALDLTRVADQPDADLKQQLVELSVSSSGTRLNSLKMPRGLQVDDLMLAVIASFGGLTTLSLEGTVCPASDPSLMSLSPMRQLQALDLSGTVGLTDDAVESLSSLSSVIKLSLRGCFEVSNEGLATLGDITALTNLDLEGCANMDDRVLEHLTRLSHLHTLNLSYCSQVTDKGIAAIAGPASSSTLFAAGDTLAGVGAAFGEFGKNLGSTFGSTFGSAFRRQSSAALDEKIPNSGNGATSQDAPLPSLTSLTLAGCPDVTDTALSSLANLSQLRTLDVLGCWMVTGAGLSSLTGLSQLQSLSIEVKEGLDDDAMLAMACLRALKHLRMERCKFCVTDRGISKLERMSLQTMELAYCSGLTDVFVATLCHVTALTSLSLLKSDIVTQAGLAVITTLKHLHALDLTGCTDVSDVIYLCLARLPELEKLVLAYCSGWSEAGLNSLAEVTTLRHLDLAYTYPLPDEAMVALANGLSSLTRLDISGASHLLDATFKAIGESSMCHLEQLDLEGCAGLERSGLAALACGLPLLNSLNLQECQSLEAEDLLVLTNLHGLRDLNIIDCPGGDPDVIDILIDSLPFLGNLAAM